MAEAKSISVDNANKNSQIYLKGDVSLLITPFDTYRLFTIYKNDTDGIPMNLSSVGTLYITFGSNKNEIKIKEYEGTKCDKTNGQVIFRLSAADCKKILNLSNTTYYITAKYTDDTDAHVKSDETMLYTGRWADEATFMSASLSKRINELKSALADAANRLSQLMSENSMLSKERDSLYSMLQSKDARIKELENELSEIRKKLLEYETAIVANGTLLDNNAQITYSADSIVAKYLNR